VVHKKWIGAVTLTLALLGCGKEEPQTQATPPASAPRSAQAGTPNATAPAGGGKVTLADLDAVTKADKPYKIVLIVKTKNNPFFIPMIAAFEQTAKELGVDSEVQAAPQETDYDKQVALVETEVGKGKTAILITPADSKGLVPALKAAQEKGVLVVNLDNRLDPETVRAQGLTLGGYVGADNEAGGKLAGEAMVAALHGKGKVAILEGIRGVDNAEARKRGFTEAVQGKLDIVDSQTGKWETEEAYRQTLNILAAHPDINGVFCANDNMAIGTMKAIQEKGKKGKITVVGYDNIPDVNVKSALASGEMAATIEQHPDSMGHYGLKMAVGILNGRVPKGGEILVPLETIKKR
jgi:ribose transport system substrate-binding protein